MPVSVARPVTPVSRPVISVSKPSTPSTVKPSSSSSSKSIKISNSVKSSKSIKVSKSKVLKAKASKQKTAKKVGAETKAEVNKVKTSAHSVHNTNHTQHNPVNSHKEVHHYHDSSYSWLPFWFLTEAFDDDNEPVIIEDGKVVKQPQDEGFTGADAISLLLTVAVLGVLIFSIWRKFKK